VSILSAKDQLVRGYAYPDSIISIQNDLIKYGIDHISCRIKSSLLDAQISQYEKTYSGLEEFIRVEHNKADYQMTLYQTGDISYVLPKMSIEYEKLEYLKPWYNHMDSATINISRKLKYFSAWINNEYGIRDEKVEIDSSTKFISLEHLRIDTTVFYNMKGAILEVEYFADNHIVIYNPPFENKTNRIEIYITVDSDDTFQYEEIFYEEDMIWANNKTFLKIDGFFLLSKYIMKHLSLNTLEEKIINEFNFTDYSIVHEKSGALD